MQTNPNGIVHISLNPTYFCNFACPTCYLTKEQLDDKKLVPLEVIAERLNEILASGNKIGHVDIYGGEVLLLPRKYLMDLKALLHSFGVTEIELITNLSTFNEEIVNDPDFGISVSFDFEARQQHEHVWKNMMRIERPFTVLTLAVPEIINKKTSDMVEMINLLTNARWWEIKPYSPNQANQLKISHNEFENLIKRIIDSPEKHFELLNEGMLLDAVDNLRNSFSDDHVYITPSGKFGVLEFDLNDNEFFLELDSFNDYVAWTVEEKAKVYENPHCGNCKYLGKCLSEHLRPVKTMEGGCNGYFDLITWAEENL